MPRVSVVIPTCNRFDSLYRAVSSVLNQDFIDLEVVIVDDNLNDSTIKILSFFNDDSRVRVVRNYGPHGPSKARNFGVESARGELIVFLDDDDCYLQGRITSLVNAYDKFDGHYVFISSGRFIEVGDFFEIRLISGQKYGEIKLSDVFYGNIIDIGFLISADFFNSIGGFDENLSSLEDWDFIIRALRRGDGYKVNRLDYVVNQTPHINRISMNEADGYFVISDKYLQVFGRRWGAFQHAKGFSLRGRLTMIKAVWYSVNMLSLKPFRLYLSRFIRR